MTILSEGRHAAEFVMSEAMGGRSRDKAVIAAEQTIEPGTPLGQIGATGTLTAASAADGGNTGDGALTLASPAVTSAARPGVYTVTCIEPASDGGTFDVEDPDGTSIGTAKIGVAFAKQVKFTIADGATDFAAGDRFTITVGAPDGTFSFKAWAPAASDGSEVARALALYGATTGEGETASIAILSRDAEFNSNMIAWPNSTTDAQKSAALESLADRGLIAR